MGNELSIVIVNFNLKKDTAECIKSLLKANASLEQIIVVDNGSTDGSVAYLREEFGEDLDCIEALQNLGYANGANLGIQQSLNTGAELILVMNNDTVVAPDFLLELKNIARQNPEYAIFGPLILYFDQPNKIWYFGSRLFPGTMMAFSQNRYRENMNKFPAVVPIDFVNGCGMMVRREVFERIGLFDTSYFMYAEEVDLCWRARLSGFKLAVAPRARMYHKISATAMRQPFIMRYYATRNQIWFYRRYVKVWQLPLQFFFSTLHIFRQCFNDLIKGYFNMLVAMGCGWFDGWFKLMELPTIPPGTMR